VSGFVLVDSAEVKEFKDRKRGGVDEDALEPGGVGNLSSTGDFVSITLESAVVSWKELSADTDGDIGFRGDVAFAAWDSLTRRTVSRRLLYVLMRRRQKPDIDCTADSTNITMV
jgi:hypothetical protein